jgi:prophage antirepressor-like protein
MSSTDKAENARAVGLPTEFKFDESVVRVAMTVGEPWFVAKDVCDILEHSDTSKAVERLDDDERGTNIVRTPGGPQTMLTVNESGLYALIFTSRKPEAKRFRKWVTSEVLPEIRKTGRYSSQDTSFMGLSGEEVEYERWLLERALLDAQVIAVEMQRIGVHFQQMITDDPELGAARAGEHLTEYHHAVRDNVYRAIDFLKRAEPGSRWYRGKTVGPSSRPKNLRDIQ